MKRIFLVLVITALVGALIALSHGMAKNSTPDADDDAIIPSTATWKPASVQHPATAGAAAGGATTVKQPSN